MNVELQFIIIIIVIEKVTKVHICEHCKSVAENPFRHLLCLGLVPMGLF